MLLIQRKMGRANKSHLGKKFRLQTIAVSDCVEWQCTWGDVPNQGRLSPLRPWSKIPLPLALPSPPFPFRIPLAPHCPFLPSLSFSGREPLIPSILQFPAPVSRGSGFLPGKFFLHLDGCGWNLMLFWAKYDHSTYAFKNIGLFDYAESRRRL